MAIANRVAAQYPDAFGRKRLGVARTVVLTSTGNNVAVIPITEATQYIVRGVAAFNANASVATGNVAIMLSPDGNNANLIANTVLTNVTSNTRYQDFTVVANTATTVFTAPALYVRVLTGVTGTVDVAVYGEAVQL